MEIVKALFDPATPDELREEVNRKNNRMEINTSEAEYVGYLSSGKMENQYYVGMMNGE